MYKRRKSRDDDFESDNYSYMSGDEDYDNDTSDEDDYGDGNSEDSSYGNFSFEEDENDKRDDIGLAIIDDDGPTNFDMFDLSGGGGKGTFDPSKYDFNEIMADYNSGDPERKKHAVEQALYAMDALVKHVINRHYPTYREKYYDDMLQEGRWAIIDTIGGYTGKCAPSSYFYTTIRHQIQVFVAEHVHRTTRHYAAMANKIRKAEIALSQIDGKDFHDDLTISVYTGLPLTTVIETRKQTLAADFVELDANMDTDDLVDTDYGNPAQVYWKEARIRAIHDALHRLLPTEEKVIKMMYGIDEEDQLTPPEIARRLHLKTEQVRKISQDACRKLANDKRLKLELNMEDGYTAQKNKLSEEMPFVPVEFGKGQNFFEELGEEEDNTVIDHIDSLEDLFSSMSFKDDDNT